MRSEGDRLLEAVDETISIARQSGTPAAIYHLKAAGKSNWSKLDQVIDKIKPLTGKTLAEVAEMRHQSVPQTAMDLVIEDGSRIGVLYFLMSEENVRKQAALPWMSFASDDAAPTPEGVFLMSRPHPRAYGNFAKLRARYVRTEKVITLSDAVHRLSGLPAANLSLKDRGLLKKGYYADIVVFDPATIQDHATYENPNQLATGVTHVVVNGQIALADGRPTGAHSGRFVRGRGWTEAKGGGCRASPRDWPWAW